METKWSVLFIGGTSGAGKTTLATALGSELGIDVMNVDLFRRSLRDKLNEEAIPYIYDFFNSGINALNLSPNALLQKVIGRAEEVSARLREEIEVDLSSKAKVIVEGDDITPELVISIPRSKAIFILEDNISEIEKVIKLRDRNFYKLEPKQQETQIETTFLYGKWIRYRAEKLGLHILEARPEADLVARAHDLLKLSH